MKFKQKFLEKYEKLTDIKEFTKYSVKPLTKSIRVNTLKISVSELKERIEEFTLKQIPWCKEGFWVTNGPRTDLGNLVEHSLGYFYVQEAASMIPPLALQPQKADTIIDMAAAPGSKTTQLASMMENQGMIIANDLEFQRLKSLGINLQRCGVMNTIVTLMKGHKFTIQADKILLDAPCSATGAIRKSLKTVEMWNPHIAKRLAGTQNQLLQTAFSCLKPRGSLVYSTCSVSPEENELVIHEFLEKNPEASIEKITLPGLKTSPTIEEYEKVKINREVKKCIRIWHQYNDTEGFFIAKILKPSAI